MTNEAGKWAVVVWDTSDGKGYFVESATSVDEHEARKAFGLAIRAIEFELPFRTGLASSAYCKINAARLLTIRDGVHPDYLDADTCFDPETWRVVQMHSERMIGVFECSRNQPMPFREDSFHPGVPCHPGAWGCPTACAMHWGLPLDEEHGMCADGIRGAKYLGLILVPKSMQSKWELRQTMTNDELMLLKAAAVAELVSRGKADHISDDVLEETRATLERALGPNRG